MPAQDLFAWADSADFQQAFNYTGAWQTWSKPRVIRMVYIFAIGAATGGGGGFSAGGATQAGGGGGGNSGCMSSLLIPAAFLPDMLYVSVSKGGLGGAASSFGSGPVPPGPNNSTVSTLPPPADGTYFSNVLISGQALNNNAIGGSPGTAIAGGSGSGAAGAFTISNGSPYGLCTSVNGLASVAGASSAAGNNINWPGAVWGPMLSGGAGGAGTTGAANAAGGGLPAVRGNPAIAGGASGGGRGPDGYAIRAPMVFTGGLGGGSNFAGTGGRGGDGAIGCGGGGGGGGVTGGAGGNGGNGLVIITCWLLSN